jgi:halogenation protein CepH
MTSSAHVDVIVIGGGPAGSTAAGFLAQAGRRVVLLEKEYLPRYHIGESLLSATLPIFEALGVLPEIEKAGFIPKPGGTFIWGRGQEPWSFFFRDDPGGRPHAFHVVRSEFDHLLVRHAALLGVDVRQGHCVREVRSNGEARVRGQRVDGTEFEISADYLVDASGQSAFLGRRDDLREFNPFFKNLAVFGYFEGAERLTGPVAGNILSAAFDEGWFWFIPLHDGTTSVGAVIDAQRFAGAAAGDAAALYERLIRQCPPVARRLRHGRLVSPVRIVRDYSYSSRRFYGDRFLLAGDAACFIDPVFSTGVHLACLSGYLAARALTHVLEGEPPSEQFPLYDRRYRSLFERYLNFLYFFYDHHGDAGSYFWQARKLLGDGAPEHAQTAFTHLVSGAADFDSAGSWIQELAARRERMARATGEERLSAMPDAAIFRAKTTERELEIARANGPRKS